MTTNDSRHGRLEHGNTPLRRLLREPSPELRPPGLQLPEERLAYIRGHDLRVAQRKERRQELAHLRDGVVLVCLREHVFRCEPPGVGDEDVRTSWRGQESDEIESGDLGVCVDVR